VTQYVIYECTCNAKHRPRKNGEQIRAKVRSGFVIFCLMSAHTSIMQLTCAMHCTVSTKKFHKAENFYPS